LSLFSLAPELCLFLCLLPVSVSLSLLDIRLLFFPWGRGTFSTRETSEGKGWEGESVSGRRGSDVIY
jgi:hypothetical protein